MILKLCYKTCLHESKPLFLYINTKIDDPNQALLPSMPKLPLDENLIAHQHSKFVYGKS